MSTAVEKEFADLLKYRKLEYIPLERLTKNPENPREPPSREDVADLCQSIELVGGILVPLVAYFDSQLNKYVILDGERRFNAAKKVGLKEVPVNVLPAPPDRYSNLRTMFNIHLQREEWNPAAKALTLEKIIELRPNLSDEELKDQTGISERDIQDLRRLLKREVPRKLVQRALDETLQASYLIEMEKYLEPCEKSFPDVFKKYPAQKIRLAFIKKVDEESIGTPTEFRKLGRIRRLCIKAGSDEKDASRLFDKYLRHMLSDVDYSPDAALEDLRSDIQPEIAQTFPRDCANFVASLRAFARTRQESLPADVRSNLREIQKRITRLLQ